MMIESFGPYQVVATLGEGGMGRTDLVRAEEATRCERHRWRDYTRHG
jgi:hypothetical protein